MYRNLFRRLTLRRRTLRLERLEDRSVPATLYGVTPGSSLVSFDSATPGNLSSTIAISGLGATELVEGIDFRPATGELFALGVNGITGRIGTINRVSGAFSQVGSTFTVAGATDYGFDFNPTNDRIRMTSSGQENFLINPNDGVVTVQGALNPGTPNIVGSAYTNNFANATTTALFAIDATSDELFQQIPATGALSLIGALGVNTSGDVGFDIAGNGTAYASLTVGGATQLYSINIGSGTATLIGQVSPGPVVLRGLAVARFSWDGGGADANWTTAANWVGDIAPAAGDDLYFPIGAAQIATSNNNFAAATVFNSINFTGTGYTIGGNGITLDRGFTDTSTGGTNNFNADVALSGTQIFSVASATQTLSLGGVISGGAGASLNKEKVAATTNNAGTLAFVGSSANTYTGTTSVNGGKLVLGKSAGVTSLVGPLVIGDGTGGLLADVVEIVVSSNVDDTANVTVNSSGLLTLTGAISDTFNALSMTGGKVDSPGGGTLLAAGSVVATSDAAGIPAIIAGNFSALGAIITVNDGPVAGIDLEVSGSLNNLSPWVKNGPGTLSFTGTAINGSGATTVADGVVLMNRSGGGIAFPSALVVGDATGLAESAIVQALASDNIADTSDVSVNSDGLFDLNGFTDSIGKLTSVGGKVVLGTGVLKAGDTTFDSNSTFNVGLVGALTSGRVETTGAVTVSGNLQLSFGAPPAGGTKIVVIANDGTDDVTGSFNGLPEGTTFTSSGTTFQITYKGGDGNDVELQVGVAPSFTSAAAAIFKVGTAGTFTITTTGTPNATISTVSTLPGGVTLVDNGNGTATLGGTPTENGVFFLGLDAANGISPDAQQFFTLTVEEAPAFTSANSFTATFGSAFTFVVTTTGFPTAPINLTGTLPSGVSFTDNGDGTANIAGTPTQSGTFVVTLNASNGVTPDAQQTFTLTVNQAPTFISADNFTATFGAAFTAPVAVSGFPNSTFSSTGTLPTGVTFTDNADGTAKVSGTPTQNGVFTITITATNGVSPDAQQTFTLTVNQAPSFTSANSFTGTFGAAMNFNVTTAGFPAATITSVGALPTGVTFTNNGDGTGKFTGTPTQSGQFALTLTAKNGITPDATQTFTLTINQAPAFTSLGQVSLTRGVAFSFPVTTTGFPAAAISAAGVFPNGVSFTDNGNGTGTISGTPTQGGTFNVTLTANNGVPPDAVQSVTIKVSDTIFAVGAGHGAEPTVNVYNSDGTLRTTFTAYDKSFGGGVTVATADVNGDGVDDVITGAGPGGGPHVKVFDGVTFTEFVSFFAYDASFTGGVFVAGGDVNGDGKADIITGADFGGGPHVRALSGSNLAVLMDFFAYDTSFNGGVRVAAGDVNADGKVDVITGAGPGGGPHVIAYSGVDRSILRSFYAFDPAFTGGVYVASGFVNNDSNADIITGAGAGGSPQAIVWSGADLAVLQSFLAYAPTMTSGVRVAALDINADGFADIITGAGKDAPSHVLAYRGLTTEILNSFLAFDPAFLGGVFVG